MSRRRWASHLRRWSYSENNVTVVETLRDVTWRDTSVTWRDKNLHAVTAAWAWRDKNLHAVTAAWAWRDCTVSVSVTVTVTVTVTVSVTVIVIVSVNLTVTMNVTVTVTVTVTITVTVTVTLTVTITVTVTMTVSVNVALWCSQSTILSSQSNFFQKLDIFSKNCLIFIHEYSRIFLHIRYCFKKFQNN